MLAGGPATLDKALHGLLRVLATQLAGLDELGDDFFGILLRHLAELHTGIEQTLEDW
mgnify:CR=1 FL=1